ASFIRTLVLYFWAKARSVGYNNPLAKANGKLSKPQISPNPELIAFKQRNYKTATYKPRLLRCQRTKSYIVENQLYLSGH
ncbi:MAG: hypothetical protein WCS03_16445, partial [Bacteroidota bacterium]